MADVSGLRSRETGNRSPVFYKEYKMTLQDYIEKKRKTTKVNADILQRWETRVVATGLEAAGEHGAMRYLSVYGKSIGAPKCLALAKCAEDHGFPDVAIGFWKKAYTLENGKEPAEDEQIPLSSTPNTTLSVCKSAILETTPFFPADKQPGKFAPMQPTDALHAREYYVNDDRYWGQPKRDGVKLIVFASPDQCFFQSRQLKLNAAPSITFENALKERAAQTGAFIVEGELYYLDAEGKEHMTGSACLARNKDIGSPQTPTIQFAPFDCIYIDKDFTDLSTKSLRVEAARQVIAPLAEQYPTLFSLMPTCTDRAGKQSLCERQEAEGREGEVWFRADCPFYAGKIEARNHPYFDGYVRTKYGTGPILYRISHVFPSSAEGHFIGGFECETLDGKPMGRVGTGYTREQQEQILQHFALRPQKTFAYVRSQGFTEYGKFRHGVFVSLANTEDSVS
jgi:bifunctional non-homologous end joining protein LigD